jgi:hypothetical protein
MGGLEEKFQEAWKKSSRRPGRKVPTNNITNSKDDILSKDNKKHSAECLCSSEIASIIDHWNNLNNPMLVIHKDATTKIYKRIVTMIKYLKSGAFGSAYAIDASFLSKHDIPKSLLKTKWSTDQIIEGLNNLSMYYTVGYYPGWNPNGDKVDGKKASMERALYNPDSGSSIFLWVCVEKPKLNGRLSADEYPAITKMYRGLFASLTNRQENLLNRYVSEIVSKHKQIVTTMGNYMKHTSFKSWVGDEENVLPFCKEHIRFLRARQENRMIVGMINPVSIWWDYFLQWFDQEHSLNLIPSKKQLSSMREESECAKKRWKERQEALQTSQAL